MYLGPLTFRDVLKAKPWGGRALGRLAGKKLPKGEPIGESWEVADHPNGMSLVEGGPVDGKSLRDLMEEGGKALLGRSPRGKRFPLLIKLLDAREQLSVQVHPDDGLAKQLKLNDPGKTEAWYIVEARKGARIVAGLKSRRVIAKLRDLAASDDLAEHLKTITPEAGEAWMCHAGTVHALGPASVLLEVQQNSDSTYRLSDWGRVGLDGKPRELHVEESIKAIGDQSMSISRGRTRKLKDLPFPAERLVECDKFVMDRWTVTEPSVRFGEGQFEILHVIDGEGVLEDAEWPEIRLKRGQTVLIPACVRAYEIIPKRALTIVRAAEAR
jgi:mannose-6-phosphate isomerase